jgi:uncharacterized protein (DUF885 family)
MLSVRRILFVFVGAAMLLPADPTQLHAQGGAKLAPVEDRRKVLNALIDQCWEASLEHSPEFASYIGDKRYNDKTTDYSVKAMNAWLEREQNWMLKLAAIDPDGLTDAEKTSRAASMRTIRSWWRRWTSAR